MKRIVRLTESDLSRIVRRVINESKLLMEDEGTDLENKFSSANIGYKLESMNLSGIQKVIISSTSTNLEVASYDCKNSKAINMTKFQQSLPIIQKYCKVAFI
jgi:hypothetical protein